MASNRPPNQIERISLLRELHPHLQRARRDAEAANALVLRMQQNYLECVREVKRLERASSSSAALEEAKRKVEEALQDVRQAQHDASEANKILKRFEGDEAILARRQQPGVPEAAVLRDAQHREADEARIDNTTLSMIRSVINNIIRQIYEQPLSISDEEFSDMITQQGTMSSKLTETILKRKIRRDNLLQQLGISIQNPQHQFLPILQYMRNNEEQFLEAVERTNVLVNNLSYAITDYEYTYRNPDDLDDPDLDDPDDDNYENPDVVAAMEQEQEQEKIIKQILEEQNDDIVKIDTNLIDNYRDDLKCSICRGYVKNIIFKCGHQVCKGCARGILSRNPNTPICSDCRAPITRVNRLLYNEEALASANIEEENEALPQPSQQQLAQIQGAIDLFTGQVNNIDVDNITDDVVRKLIECIRCHNNVRDIKLNCGHQVCRRCLRELMKQSNPRCPICNSPLYIKGIDRVYKKYLKYKNKYLQLKNKN